MVKHMPQIDVLCLGHACYDLIFTVDHQPGADEKARADAFLGCGGGTAANAAMTVAKLGHTVVFAGYLGQDIYGDEHLSEFHAAGVESALVVRGPVATPISAIFVKPDGARSIVNYKGNTNDLGPAAMPFQAWQPRVVLFDGHQPALAVAVAAWARAQGIPSVLDADSVNEGNAQLVHLCDVVAASERFAEEFTGASTPEEGMSRLAELAPTVIVTLGERGLIWQRGDARGSLPAFPVKAIDTTGAGDAFHGALAAGLAAGREWQELLRYASAVGALCCTKHGARLGIPNRAQVEQMLTA